MGGGPKASLGPHQTPGERGGGPKASLGTLGPHQTPDERGGGPKAALVTSLHYEHVTQTWVENHSLTCSIANCTSGVRCKIASRSSANSNSSSSIIILKTTPDGSTSTSWFQTSQNNASVGTVTWVRRLNVKYNTAACWPLGNGNSFREHSMNIII